MKKVKLLLASAFCATLTAAFLFTGCKEKTTNSSSTGLEGEWMMDPEDYEGDPDIKIMVTFAGDGTTKWVYCAGEVKDTTDVMSGTWAVDGNHLNIVFFYEDEDEDGKDIIVKVDESVKYKIDGNTLTMTDSDEEKMELTKTN